MKSLFLLFLSPLMFAQVLISTKDSVNEPHKNAILQLEAEKGALILPALTTQSVNEIKAEDPVAGMIVFDKEKKQFFGFNGDDWIAFGAVSSNANTPLANDVIFTEFMINPTGDDKTKEWFEVYNTTSKPLNLKSCVFNDNNYSFEINGDLIIPQNGFLVFGATKDLTLNNNTPIDYTYGYGSTATNFNFSNTGALNVTLVCNQEIIDQVVNLTQNSFPVDEGMSTALLPDKFNARDNDLPKNYISQPPSPKRMNLIVPDISPNEIRINEFHYDNSGSDDNEFIEVRADKGLDVSSVKLYLYNGSGGNILGNKMLSSLSKSTDAQYDYYVWEGSLQKGPDGIALANGNNVLEFISYEGIITATEGPASGMSSQDTAKTEDNATSATASISRDSAGNWSLIDPNTKGKSND